MVPISAHRSRALSVQAVCRDIEGGNPHQNFESETNAAVPLQRRSFGHKSSEKNGGKEFRAVVGSCSGHLNNGQLKRTEEEKVKGESAQNRS